MSGPGAARAAGKLLLAAALFLAVVESLTTTVAWWRGEKATMEPWDWFWVALLPLLVAVWLRYFSIFGRKQPPCLLPEDQRKP